MSDRKNIAHKREDDAYQTILEHAKGVADLAYLFAKPFGGEEEAYQIGLGHDIGKYSDDFQEHIRGNMGKVDHSTAGAKEMMKIGSVAGMYVASGHHGGLPDAGGKFDMPGQMPTLTAKIKKAIPDYSAFKKEIMLRTPEFPKLSYGKHPGFCKSFYIRMMYSCLVDADYLDTEQFMRPETKRPDDYLSIKELCDILEKYIQEKGYLSGSDGINAKRSEILKNCIDKGKGSDKGLYTLTVPTGGGKTIASLAFALEHAKKNGLKRVIFVVPYCAIIDQTVDIYKEIFGEKNVLAHYSEAQYENREEGGDSKHLAAENWDMPIIVTTAVQFFESMFANKPSKCRKLHNIAESVVIFDEAQTIPIDYLRPCIYTISELTLNYKTSCVLCTATQPAIDFLVNEYDPQIKINEIITDPQKYFKDFQRVRYEDVGKITIEDLAARISKEKQVLCIVATRKDAKNLYDLTKSDNTFHLSTLMPPAKRRKTLEIIRRKLASGEECRVISTSLIEAGVDIDFPCVYKARAGLESVAQAGGRCNREGRLDAGVVRVFELTDERYVTPEQDRRRKAEMFATKNTDDYASPATIEKYYNYLYSYSGKGNLIRNDFFDTKQIVSDLDDGAKGNMYPFKKIADKVNLIDDKDQKTVFIPIDQKAKGLADILISGGNGIDKGLYRKVGPYCVNIFDDQIWNIKDSLIKINDDLYVLTDMSLYNEKTGLKIF